ncbi:MAG: ion transporter [Oscillospiraceae bacterium]|nr:ion transporter [Oscillospiraceae bacterium]
MDKAKLKRRIFDIIQIGNREDVPSRIFDVCLVAVILLNILSMFLETFDELAAWRGVFETVELVTVILFCVEYLLRIWTAEYLYPGESRGRAVLKFLRSYDGVIDLLTILPFFFLSGFVVFRMLRVVRIFHLFRINPRYDSFNVIKSVIYEKRNQIASSVFIIVILMLASSLCMYSVEHEVQPENFRNALSGIWWSVSTLMTVGYGDIYPVTELGRAMAIVITFLGVGAVALPTGIISAGFVEQYSKMQQETPKLAGELTAITITVDSAWIGKTVEDIEKEYGVDIVLVRRKGKVTAPKQHYTIREGDEVAYL